MEFEQKRMMGFRRAVQIQILLTDHSTRHAKQTTTTIKHHRSIADRTEREPTMSTFTAAPGATGGQPAWVQNARARGTSEETTPQGGGVGVDFIPTAEHAAGLDETETHIIGCLPDYRNRIMEIIRFIRNEPSYRLLYEELIIELTPEQRANTRLYHNATHDIRYDRLSSKVMKVFMSGFKKKNLSTGKHYNKDHIRKYHDAVLKCAEIAGVSLQPRYLKEMKAHLLLVRKEHAAAKGEGTTEDKEADPISFDFYKQLNLWLIDDGLIGDWAYSTMQWNCVARSCNIDALGFHNLSRSQGADSVVIKYDVNKKDKAGENVTPKNCYANPKDGTVCMFLALGCYLSLQSEKFKRDSDKIFRRNGKKGTAAEKYCKSLKTVINSSDERKKAARLFVRLTNFHPHGSRKGAATHVTTNTMEPPPMPSILLRGEWSLGKVLDIYWRWSAQGDTYLGRLLCGLDPDDLDFGILPPYFKEGAANEYVAEAMRLCFGPILDVWSEKCTIKSSLLLFLASMVWHSDLLVSFTATSAGHPFQNIPILQNPHLLQKLKELVTCDPGFGITGPSGVPRHIKNLKLLYKILNTAEDSLQAVLDLATNLPKIVSDAISQKAAESGQVTVEYVMDAMKESTTQLRTLIETTVQDSIREATKHLVVPSGAIMEEHAEQDGGNGGVWPIGDQREYKHSDGSYYAVPPGFQLASCSLRLAWNAWLQQREQRQ